MQTAWPEGHAVFLSSRAFLVAYSPEPVINRKGQLWNQAEPFLRSGVRVSENGSAV
jgi:hypothetical protein